MGTYSPAQSPTATSLTSKRPYRTNVKRQTEQSHHTNLTTYHATSPLRPTCPLSATPPVESVVCTSSSRADTTGRAAAASGYTLAPTPLRERVVGLARGHGWPGREHSVVASGTGRRGPRGDRGTATLGHRGSRRRRATGAWHSWAKDLGCSAVDLTTALDATDDRSNAADAGGPSC
jgi:hypothetical protein